MRTLPAFAAFALITSTLSPAITDACGIAPPRLAVLSSHWGPGASETRSFVVFPEKVTVDRYEQWTLLAPRSYDNARIAERDSNAMKVTLVGESGTNVIEADHRVVLDNSFNVDMEAHDALEVPVGRKDQFSIAILGDARGARWESLEKAGLTTTTRYTKEQPGYAVDVMRDNVVIGTYTGQVLGVLVHRGVRWIVEKDGATARADRLF